MRKIAVLIVSALAFIGCQNAAKQTVNTNVPAKSADDSALVSGHSQTSANAANIAPHASATSVPKSEVRTKWKQTGNPIDTSGFDAEIAKSEKDLKAAPKDVGTKKNLADAYLRRATALTQAGQYASAIGDYRRVLKFDANNEEAKTWVAKIIELYDGMNKEYPKDGEEPPALPFKKEV